MNDSTVCCQSRSRSCPQAGESPLLRHLKPYFPRDLGLQFFITPQFTPIGIFQDDDIEVSWGFLCTEMREMRQKGSRKAGLKKSFDVRDQIGHFFSTIFHHRIGHMTVYPASV